MRSLPAALTSSLSQAGLLIASIRYLRRIQVLNRFPLMIRKGISTNHIEPSSE